MKYSNLLTNGALSLVLSLISLGAVANNIGSAQITGIHSTTFDGPISASNPSKLNGGSAVVFNAVGTSHGGVTETGTGILKFNGDTLYLGSVVLPDMDVVITSGGVTNVQVSGASMNLSAPKFDATSGSFSVDGGTNVVADVSAFTDATVSCSGPGCPAIPFLNLDGLNYTLDGTLTPAGGDTLTLTLETNNGSLLSVEVVTEPLEVTANVASVEVLGIHSTTFDGPISASNPSKLTGGSAVSFNNVGTANGGITETGTGVIYFDGDTLSLGSFLFPDQDIIINSGGITNVSTMGGSISLSTPKVDSTPGSFAVDGGTNIVADFSSFSDATVSCVGPGCPAIPFLNLDGLNYTLTGNVTPEGGDVLVLTLETNNGSLLAVQITTEVAGPEGANVPFPVYGLMLLALALVASGIRRKLS